MKDVLLLLKIPSDSLFYKHMVCETNCFCIVHALFLFRIASFVDGLVMVIF